MSQISQLLLNRAEELRSASPEEVAVDLLKQAGYSDVDARIAVAQNEMEKVAANELVTYSGIDIEQAVALVKAAGINLKDMKGFEVSAPEVDPTIELLQKAAQYIESLEAEIEGKNEEIEKAASDAAIQEIKLPEQFNKAASAGAFTFEDSEQLKGLEPETLQKIATVMDTPWEMGHGVGMVREKTDPVLEWLLT